MCNWAVSRTIRSMLAAWNVAGKVTVWDWKNSTWLFQEVLWIPTSSGHNCVEQKWQRQQYCSIFGERFTLSMMYVLLPTPDSSGRTKSSRHGTHIYSLVVRIFYAEDVSTASWTWAAAATCVCAKRDDQSCENGSGYNDNESNKPEYSFEH